MTMTSSMILEQVHQRLRSIEEESKELQRLQRGLGADIVNQKDELEPAWNLLTEILLSDLQPVTLTALTKRVPITALSLAAVQQRRTTILADANNRLRALLADPRVHNAEALLNEIDIGLSELEPSILPLRISTRMLEEAPLFLELLQWRYGTDEYSVKFWQLDFYRHWKHGDIIAETHGPRMKKTDFKGIAAQYVEEKSALNELELAKAAMHENKKAIEVLRTQVTENQAIVADVDAVVLKNARSRLKDYLRVVAEADVFRVLAGDEAAVLAYKRVVGITKKQQYLTALNDQQVKSSLGELHQLKNKLLRTRAKLERPKNRHAQWPDSQGQRMAGQDRGDKWRKRRASYDNARTHVVEFHHYDRYDPVQNFLWWDVMTDGRLDGNFIDEVRERGPSHYPRHNDVRDNDNTVQPAWRSDELSDVS